MKELWSNIKKAAVAAWVWFKGLPIVKPLFLLLYSRKAMISVALVGFMLEYFPKLSPVKDELLVLVAQVVVIVLVAVANSLGIAIEDAAAKSNSLGGFAG
jgi:hypothetical protein